MLSNEVYTALLNELMTGELLPGQMINRRDIAEKLGTSTAPVLEAMKQLILDEVNVKELRFVEGNMLEKTVKCNFRVMGKKFGKLMKAVAAAVAEMSQEQIATLETVGSISLMVEGESALIERADVEIVSQDIPGWTVANEGVLTVALDIEITDELRREGLAREIVKRIQNHRKESGFEITDRIFVKMEKHPALEEAVDSFRDYICGQVLADTFEFVEEVATETEFDFEDFKVNVSITK